MTASSELCSNAHVGCGAVGIRMIYVLIGLLLVLVGLFAMVLSLLTWVAFIVGLILLGFGLSSGQKSKGPSEGES